MKIKKWDELPSKMQNEAVRRYYDILCKKKRSLVCKRIADIVVSLAVLIVFLPFFIIISIIICFDSNGGPFFKQERITQYGKRFKIIKFRTMVMDAEKSGISITVSNDVRITKVGRFLRKTRIDEVPQIFNILKGDMTLVGTRPEISKYVDRYTDEMMSTLLLPAGVTSEASIMYKDEHTILTDSTDVDSMYIESILPIKMDYNLVSLENFSFIKESYTIFRTVMAVCGIKFDSIGHHTKKAIIAKDASKQDVIR